MLSDVLNEREIEIIGLLAEGLANKEIANRLFLAPNTVKWYIKQINSKLDTSNRDEIVEEAQNRKLLNRDKETKSHYERPKSNLPRQSTPFVGRDAELDEVHAILEKPDLRLITILAPGGMGKSRLALEAAEQQLGRFKDGVYFVGLQALGSFDEQLVAVLRQFITMLREGYSLIQCFQYVAENAPEPTADASRQLLSDLKAGMEFPAAIDAMKGRVRSAYFARVVGTIQLQFREGGNLAERFDILEAEFRKDLGDLRWSNKREYAEQLIIPALAESVFFSFQADERSQKEQLLNFLANKEMLLVTDNWEHLLDGAALLNEILQAAPKLKILATSREKLNLLGETVYVLQGMDFPTWESPEDALQYDAVQLLLQAARQVKPDWQISQDNLDFVSRVCRLTQGMPLGILLAVSWLDMLSIEEIAQEIASSADFLEAQFANVSERQHSIRAIFNYAWNKLSEQEQAVFMKLSVFRGGFTREAAKEVAEANLQSLHRLMEKALVMRLTDDRYDLHELLRQYAEEKLKLSGEEETGRSKHASYFRSFIEAQWPLIKDYRQKEALDKLEPDFDNLLVAWRYLLETGRVLELRNAINCFGYFVELRKKEVQVLALLNLTIQTLEALPVSQARNISLGNTLSKQSGVLVTLGQHEAAYLAGEKAIELLQRCDNAEEVIIAYASLAKAAYFYNQHEVSREASLSALKLAETSKNKWGEVHSLYWLGGTYHIGEDNEQAMVLVNRAASLAKEVGDTWIQSCIEGVLRGNIFLTLGRLPEARESCRIALPGFMNINDIWGIGTVYMIWGASYLIEGDYQNALPYFVQGAAYRLAFGHQWMSIPTLLELASAFIHVNNAPLAIKILGGISSSSELPEPMIKHLEAFREAAQAQVEERQFEEAWQAGVTLGLEKAAREVLNSYFANEKMLPPNKS